VNVTLSPADFLAILSSASSAIFIFATMRGHIKKLQEDVKRMEHEAARFNGVNDRLIRIETMVEFLWKQANGDSPPGRPQRATA
jgi:hypothetical protein